MEIMTIRRGTWLGLAAVLVVAVPVHGQTGAAADSAWSRGDRAVAERLYGALLAVDSSNAVALQRLGLLRAWKGRYEESLALLDRLVQLEPENLDARVDRARVLAWSGHTDAALTAVNEVLERDPTAVSALRARAQFESWTGSYQQALSTYDRILQITPEDVTARYDRARVLAWSSRFGAAQAVYDSLLAVDPHNRSALLGLAQVLTWSNAPDSAASVYRHLLNLNQRDGDALRGLARVTAMVGDLAEGEGIWREAVADAPGDAAAQVGLAQTLRWEGRNAAALEVLRATLAADPTNPEARTLLASVEFALSPRVAPRYSYESDSDGNRIATTVFYGLWHPAPRLELRADGYLRRARMVNTALGTRQAQGGTVGASLQLEPGWTVQAAAGASGSDAPGSHAEGTVRATLSSPARYRAGGTISAVHTAYDATAALMIRQVVTDEVSLSAYTTPAPGWTVTVSGSAGVYRGGVSGLKNQRYGGRIALTRRFSTPLTVGLSTRAFSFENDLNDGYFDPNFYGVGELTARWAVQRSHWGLDLDLAPGVQKVGNAGDASGSFRVNGGLNLRLAPGRQLHFGAAYANAGLERLSSAVGSQYRYHAFTLSALWTF